MIKQEMNSRLLRLMWFGIGQMCLKRKMIRKSTCVMILQAKLKFAF